MIRKAIVKKKMRENPKCLIRHQSCNRIFEGSRICFIATPFSDEVELELSIIKQKLKENNVEPYIAAEEREYQKDIFCEKICSKIIESLFCIVILNDIADVDGCIKPNANVYYEYGLMTSFNKKIIPIQKEGQDLAFNIRSLDTIKYTNTNFTNQIEDAIKFITLSIEEEKQKESIESKDNLKKGTSIPLRLYTDFLGLKQEYYRNLRDLRVYQLAFDTYTDEKNESLVFVGIFNNRISIGSIIIYLKTLCLRIKNLAGELTEKLDSDLYGLETINESKTTLSKLSKAKIIILKEEFEDIESIKNSFRDICKKYGLEIKLEIIDRNKASGLIK